jgi:hypothetical protein
MGGDALQMAAVHTATAAMAYLTNIMNSFLNGKPTQMASVSLGLGSRLEAAPRLAGVSMSQAASAPRGTATVCEQRALSNPGFVKRGYRNRIARVLFCLYGGRMV